MSEEIKKPEKCFSCDGTGRVFGEYCWVCWGAGVIIDEPDDELEEDEDETERKI